MAEHHRWVDHLSGPRVSSLLKHLSLAILGLLLLVEWAQNLLSQLHGIVRRHVMRCSADGSIVAVAVTNLDVQGALHVAG